MASVIGPTTIVNQAALAANYTSPSIDVVRHEGWSIGFTSDGDLLGTIKLQGANVDTAMNYADIKNASSTMGAATTPVMFVANLARYKFVRAVFTYTSGTGNLIGTFIAKGV
jgi:hypothetical protein